MAVPTTVCFVQVDPSFYVALDAINELNANRPQNVGTVTVGNDGLRSTKNDNVFVRNYDFSRTLGAVLRAFMLKATGMVKYYHPDVESEVFNVAPDAGYFIDPAQPNIELIPDRDAKDPEAMRQAKEVSGNFDRLYPHILIEKKLNDAGLDQEVSFPGMMLIVDLDMEPDPDHPRVIKFHQINTTVRFTKREGKKFDCPKPSVVYISSNVLRDGEDGRRQAFQKLMEMIERHLEIVGQRDAAAPQPEEQAAPDAAQPEEEGQDVAQVNQGVKNLHLEAT